MLLAFAILLFFILPSNVYASSSVVLNEIFASSSSDWVEIYNPSDNEIDISGWKLKDSASTPMKIIPSNTKIAPKGFLAVEVSNRLNNSGDSVKIIRNDGTQVDSYSYTSARKGHSYKRIPDGAGKWYETSGTTKETSNGTNPPKNASPAKTGKLTLSEFMPNPDGGSEWAEVYNPNSYEVSAEGWKIDDIDGASSPFSIPSGTKIKAKSYNVFSFSSKLNNSGDSIRLLNPNGNVVEKYSFSETEKGLSFAKDLTGSWKLTITPTPGSANKITLASGESVLSSETGQGSSKSFASDINESTAGSAFSDQEIGNYSGDENSEGKVAGIAKAVNGNNKYSTLLIATGVSFVLTAFVWPFIEKRFWSKKK